MADVNATTSAGEPPLHAAARNGHVSVIATLLAAGADVNRRSGAGETPLRVSHVDAVAPLLAAGGHWGTACEGENVVNPDGHSPPCVAVAACALPSVLNTRTNRCDCPAPNIGADGADAPGDCHGENALHTLSGAGDLDTVSRLIIVHMADVNAKTSAGETPLHNAARNGHATVIATLLAAGADADAKTNIGFTPLHLAASQGRVSAVLALLAGGADVHATTNSGATPLGHAASQSQSSVYPALIAAGGHWGTVCGGGNVVNPAGSSPPCVAAAECASPSVRNAGTNLCDCPAPNVGTDGADAPGDCYGENALHTAAGAGDLDVVNYLITVHMADVNATTSAGETPLHEAAGSGHVSVVATLIAAGASVNAQNNNGETPLHNAAKYGHVSVVAALLAAGADVNAQDNNGETPLRVAEAHSQGVLVFPLLLAAGGHWGEVCANGNVVNRSGSSPPCVCESPKVGTDLGACEVVAVCASPSVWNAGTNRCDCPAPDIGADGADAPGDCHAEGALHEAAEAGDLDVVSHLIAVHMADVNVKDGIGRTPLHLAALSGHAAVAAALLAAGADWSVEDEEGEVALYIAARLGHVSVVATLIMAGANVNMKSFGDEAPLHGAAWHGHVSVVATLLAGGADWSVKDNNGRTPLHLAALSGHAAVAAALLAAGADWSVEDEEGEAALYLAARLGHVSVVATLIAAGANVNMKSRGEAPLHGAAWFGHVSVVATLLAGGADVDVKNYSDETPLHHAACLGHVSVVSALLAAGAAVNVRTHFQGGTSLHCTASIGRVSVVAMLLAAGADVNVKNNNDETPLLNAAQNGRAELITLLLERGADADAKDGGGDTALHFLAQLADTAENVGLVSFLLEKGADPNLRNVSTWRPLDLAYHGGTSGGSAWQARRKIMAALIKGGATWSGAQCAGGAIPNEKYRSSSDDIAECVCPPHLSERDSRGVCECPSGSHSQVNGLCLPNGSAEMTAEMKKMEAELPRLRATLAALNRQLSLAAESPRETVEEIAARAYAAAQGIKRRRANFIALSRTDLAGPPPPPVARSDTETECRMLGGRVRIHSATGMRVCSGIDENDTFCLVDSDGAFPCRGLFRHVRVCNDEYNRAALNPFLCGMKCGAEEAAGKECVAP